MSRERHGNRLFSNRLCKLLSILGKFILKNPTTMPFDWEAMTPERGTVDRNIVEIFRTIDTNNSGDLSRSVMNIYNENAHSIIYSNSERREYDHGP